VVSILIKLTNGTPKTKVRLNELTDSLRSEYRGAKEDFLFSLVVKAEEDRVVERETDREGVAWTFLRVPFAPDVQAPISRSNPVPHTAVASVIQSLAVGNATMQVPMDSVHAELCRRGYATTVQGAVDMIKAATAAHVMWVQRDEEGERYATLEDPKLSRSVVIPSSLSERQPLPSEITRLLPVCSVSGSLQSPEVH
jgi:hypothetical protein